MSHPVRLLHLEQTEKANGQIPCWYVIVVDEAADDFDAFSGFTPDEAIQRAAHRIVQRERRLIKEQLELEPLWVRQLPRV